MATDLPSAFWVSPKTILCRMATSPWRLRALSVDARGVALRLTSASEDVVRHRMSRHSTSKLVGEPPRTLTVTPSTGVMSQCIDPIAAIPACPVAAVNNHPFGYASENMPRARATEREAVPPVESAGA